MSSPLKPLFGTNTQMKKKKQTHTHTNTQMENERLRKIIYTHKNNLTQKLKPVSRTNF